MQKTLVLKTFNSISKNVETFRKILIIECRKNKKDGKITINQKSEPNAIIRIEKINMQGLSKKKRVKLSGVIHHSAMY